MKQITVEHNGVDFDFYNNSNGVVLREFEGFEYPMAKAIIDEVSGPDGYVHVNSKYSRRIVNWVGDFIGSDVFSLRRQMLDPLEVGELKLIKITTYDDLELQFEAEVLKIDNPYNHSVNTFRVEMVAPDWRFYDQVLTEETFPETKVIGGAEIPAAIPMSIWSDVDLGNTVENEGNEVTLPIFVIHGPGTNFRIVNQATGKELLVEDTLAIGEEITIDVKERTIFKGTDSIRSKFSGDWVGIMPGVNSFGFGASSGSDSNTELEVKFRSAYNGI